MTLLHEQLPTESSAEAEALFKQARRRRRRLRLLTATIVMVSILVGSVVLVSTASNRRTARAPAPQSTSTRHGALVPTDSDHPTTAYVADAGRIVPVSLASNRVEPPIPVPELNLGQSSTDVVVSPSGTTAYTVSLPQPLHSGSDQSGPTVVLINLVQRRVESEIPFSASAIQPGVSGSRPSFFVDALALTPNGRTLLIADAADNEILSVDLSTRRLGTPVVLPKELPQNWLIKSIAQPTYSPRPPAPITDLAISPDGKMAYVVDGYAVIPVDLADHRAEQPIKGFDGPDRIAISPDGQTAYVTNPYCWEVIHTGQCQLPPRRPLVEPNGRIQLFAGGDEISVVNLSGGRIARTLTLGKASEPTGIAVSPDGSLLYVTHGAYSPQGRFLSVLTPTGIEVVRIDDGLGVNTGANAVAIAPAGSEAYLSSFQIVTPGPFAPTVLRGVIAVNLKNRTAGSPVDFGSPVAYGTSTGGVAFGR